MTAAIWCFKGGSTLGGFVVGHLAKMSGNPNPAFIVGLRRDGPRTKVLLDFIRPQPVDGPEGSTARRVEVAGTAISSTWRAGPTVYPERRNLGLPEVHEFGSAPNVVPKDYSFRTEVHGTPEEVQKLHAGKPVILVKSAELHRSPGRFAIGVFAWNPMYSRWRHGGWYVDNLRYPTGGCGCVSNNYDDNRWRIACDERRVGLYEPGDFTFPSRDAAARAELEYVHALNQLSV